MRNEGFYSYQVVEGYKDLPNWHEGKDVILFIQGPQFEEEARTILPEVIKGFGNVEVFLLEDHFDLEAISIESDDTEDYYDQLSRVISNHYWDKELEEEYRKKAGVIIQPDPVNNRVHIHYTIESRLYFVKTNKGL